MQRSLLLFQNSIHSKETLRVYQYSLDKFLSHFKLRDYDSLARMDTKMLQQMIEDYVMEKKSQGKARSTIKTPVSALELFCDANGLSLNWKKINRLLPPLKKKTGSRAYSTEQIQKMLDATTDIRNKAIIHFLAASGVRIGALPDLKIKHIKDMTNGCKRIMVYPNELEEYVTFLTPEASGILNDYLEKRTRDGEHLTPESPLFRQVYAFGMAKAKPLKKVSIQAIIDRILRRAGLRFGRDGSRRDTQLDHGFRKRWNTIIKTTDGVKIILAEKMFGHTTPTIPLDETYVDATDIKLFEEYKKAIPELTIGDSSRKQILLDNALQEKSELEKKIQEVNMQQDEVARQGQVIENLVKELNELKQLSN